MDDQQILDALSEIFHDLFGDDDIVLTPEMSAPDIDGWDSIKHISLIVAIEQRFAIKLTNTEIERLNDIGDLVSVIRNHVH